MQVADSEGGEDMGKEQVSIEFEDLISRIGVGKGQYLLLLLTAGGYLATCSELLVFVFINQSISKVWSIDDATFAWLPFSTSVMGLFGSFIFGLWSDKKGRQLPFVISIEICAVFGLASVFSTNFWIFILLRSFVSFGIGGIFTVDFVLLMEFLPIEKRGKFMVIITLSGSFGVTFTSGMAWLLIPNNHWRLFVAMCSVPILIVFIIRLVVNIESPRFLLSKGKHEAAKDILKRIAKQNKTTFALEDVTQIKFFPEKKSHNFYDLFSKEFIWQTSQITVIWFLQSTGYWGVTIFFPKYLKKFNIQPYFNMFMNICAQIPGFLLVILMIDSHRFGRLWTLRIFIIGTMTSLFLATFLQDEISISVLSMVTYFFMPPIYSILQTYTAEIYPTLLRSSSMSWASIVISIPGMTTAFIGAKLIASPISWLYPLIWGIVFFIQLLVAMTLTKETSSKPIEEGYTKLGGTEYN